MSKVENNLIAIYNEKVTKIIPENIAKGIRIFNTTGSYEGAIGYSEYEECIDLASSILYSEKTVTVPEIKACYVDKAGSPDTAFYTTNYGTVDGSNAWVYRTFMQYDFSKILYPSQIISAKLHFFVQGGNDNYKQGTSIILPVTSSWEENTTTWNSQPTIGNYVSGTTPEFSLNVNVGYEFVIDITDYVEDWLINKVPNYGICFKALTEGEYRRNWNVYNRRYNSGQYATYIELKYVGGYDE